MELVDGVKLFDDDDAWTLVVPDPEEATTLVRAEAPTLAEAEHRVASMTAQIQAILAEPTG